MKGRDGHEWGNARAPVENTDVERREAEAATERVEAQLKAAVEREPLKPQPGTSSARVPAEPTEPAEPASPVVPASPVDPASLVEPASPWGFYTGHYDQQFEPGSYVPPLVWKAKWEQSGGQVGDGSKMWAAYSN